MATGTSPSKTQGTATPKFTTGRKIRIGIIIVLVSAILWLVFNFADLKAQARLGTAYGAHVACSCRYIEGHDLEPCYKNFEDGMGMITLTDDPQNKRVTATVPLLAKAVAERRGTFGCHQLDEKEIEALD